MSMSSIREYYGVPAKRGVRIVYSGYGSVAVGTIVGARGYYLRVRFDDVPTQIATLHPTWEIEYLGSNE